MLRPKVAGNAEFKIPSKTFLTGEYAVLKGSRALVMTHAPYFTCSFAAGRDTDSSAKTFHKDSPAGRLEVELSGAQHQWNFLDPHLGSGGFGGSTAEFIAVYKFLKPDGNLMDLRQRYFALFKKDSTPPSGADLTAQFSEVSAFLIYNKAAFNAVSQSWPFDGVGLLILKTDAKLATHEHLDSLIIKDFSKLSLCSDSVVDAFLAKDLDEFLKGVDDFSREQSRLGLLNDGTGASVQAICKLDGVLTARGCGAMGADVLAVFVKKDSLDYVWTQIEKLGKGLKKVTAR